MTKYIVIGLLVLVAIIGGLYGLQYLGGDGVPARVVSIESDDWVRGNKDAKVVLIEYADFQCPACGAYHPLVKQIEAAFPNDLAVVYRHFPLPQHGNAKTAAYAAEAAGNQGKFFEMHDRIFETQKEWESLKPAEAAAKFLSYARELRLDETRFSADVDSSEVKNKINQSYSAGSRVGVASTPTFYLNGKKIANPATFEGFKALIETAILEVANKGAVQ